MCHKNMEKMPKRGPLEVFNVFRLTGATLGYKINKLVYFLKGGQPWTQAVAAIYRVEVGAHGVPAFDAVFASFH